MLYRHGDVLIQKVRSIPKSAEKMPGRVLAEGEVTGHSHRIRESGVANLLSTSDNLYLRVTGKLATVVHEEHGPIELPKGMYRVWRQREYTPEKIVIVRD